MGWLASLGLNKGLIVQLRYRSVVGRVDIGRLSPQSGCTQITGKGAGGFGCCVLFHFQGV